jgi:hypothetical protein
MAAELAGVVTPHVPRRPPSGRSQPAMPTLPRGGACYSRRWAAPLASTTPLPWRRPLRCCSPQVTGARRGPLFLRGKHAARSSTTPPCAAAARLWRQGWISGEKIEERERERVERLVRVGWEVVGPTRVVVMDRPQGRKVKVNIAGVGGGCGGNPMLG